ncbi:MAG: hypothetical protein JJU33_10940 [Phycisphaerales bacterium]|nr:hypothetical protein [Phycisphaerales bacterium]
MKTNAMSLLCVGALCAGSAFLAGCGERTDPAPAEIPAETAAEGEGRAPATDTLATNERPADAQPRDPSVIDRLRIGEFEVAVRRTDDGGQRLTVARGTREMLSRSVEAGGRLTLGSGAPESAQTVFGRGQDVTGDGTVDLIVTEFTGGSNCCTNYYIYRVGSAGPELVDEIRAEYGGRFADLNRDGKPEFEGRDWSFAHWRASFAESPAPRIVLAFDGRRYKLSTELMRTSAPNPRQLEEKIESVLLDPSWEDGRPPVTLWSEALDLIYSGHPELGMRFIRMAWPSNIEGADEFIAEFRERLNESPHAGDLNLPERG